MPDFIEMQLVGAVGEDRAPEIEFLQRMARSHPAFCIARFTDSEHTPFLHTMVALDAAARAGDQALAAELQETLEELVEEGHAPQGELVILQQLATNHVMQN